MDTASKRRRRLRRFVAPVTTVALVAASLFVTRTEAFAADESIAVDFSAAGAAPTYRASGWIYGMTENAAGPPENFFRDVHFRYMRAGGAQLPGGGWVGGGYDRRWNATKAQMVRTRALGGEFVLLVHDLWGADGASISRFPGDNGNWTDYDNFLTRVFNDVRATGVPVQWDLWNEPNITIFWNRPISQYLELWRRTYQRVRTAFPDQLIVGPSCACVPGTSGFWTQFLDYAKANNAVPDIVSWHSLPGDPVANVATANSTLNARGIPHPRPYQINEYGASNEQNPGDGSWYIARLERAGADGLRANWASGGNLHNDLGNLLVHNSAGQYQPKGEWWVYQFYATQTGETVAVTPSANYDAFATRAAGSAKVLIGGGRTTGNIAVNLRRLDATSGIVQDNRVRVLVKSIPYNNGGAVTAPVTHSDTVVSLSGNAATLNLPHNDVNQTFTVEILPPVAAAPNAPAGGRSCDIYATGGTPCVAAHSTTRALYAAYNGPLYQVRRSSDNTTRDVGVVSAGGYANAAAQDSFCAGTTCLITVVYDQSGRNNHLTQAPPGTWKGPEPGGWDRLANATAAPTTVNGAKAYGVFISPGTGYRNNKTNGVATGDQPEGIYAVVDGVHYNNWCCFDYGNAQTTNTADSPAIMETVYFGADKQWGWGAGNGPWIMADLEWGLFSGVNAGYNNIPTVNHRYVTAVVKGEPNHWAIRGGNAQSGGLSTMFDGARPKGYHPMKKQGAILLGIGGDNSVSGAGTFYEGALTAGYPSDATENAVQADITAAGYK
jgi:Alpha-L-arabinofuranosidase B, catalytic